jgi:FAD/FMN-containing dehydrogenase
MCYIHMWYSISATCPSIFASLFTSALLNVRYDLARLIIGSEGTLGVITEVTLRLQKLPSHSVVSICFFYRVVSIF